MAGHDSQCYALTSQTAIWCAESDWFVGDAKAQFRNGRCIRSMTATLVGAAAEKV